MKIIAFILSLFLSFTCFSQQSKSFRLSGRVINDFDGYVYLSYKNKTDSCRVINGKFSFEGSVQHPTEARLHLKKAPSEGFYLENSVQQIEVSIQGTLVTISSLTGNETAALLTDLEKFYMAIESDPNLAEKLYNRLDSLFTQHVTNPVCGELLGDVIMDPVFSYEQAYSLYTKLDSTVMTDEIRQSIHISLNELKNSRIGKSMPPIELPDIKGRLVGLADYKSKIVLVEFWASGCAPCRLSNPELKRLYSSYKQSGFEIYGVSIDRSKDAWLRAVKEDGLTWTNVYAAGEWKSPVLKSLAIQYIPSNYLIDRNGNIVAINIKAKDLEQKLVEVMSK